MRIGKRTRAISTLLAVLLILFAAIIGALISYIWALAPYYVEPEGVVDLVITDVNFPVANAASFNVTVMNPSHSIAGTNITSVFLTPEGSVNLTRVTETNPSLPFFIERGTSATINCNLNWGEFAGKSVTVGVQSLNNSGTSFVTLLKAVKVDVTPTFNSTESVGYFNLTLKNDASSTINLTISKITLDLATVQNLSITLPRVLAVNETLKLTCFANWIGHDKPVVTVETLEGYSFQARREVPSAVLLRITDFRFNEENTSEVSMTFANSPDSATVVQIANITFTHANITDIITGNLANPVLPYYLPKNSSVTFNCTWDWTDKSLRDINVTVTAYTTQGFKSTPFTVRTPLEVAAKISDVKLDLDDTGHFLINVTNLPYSLQTINVTEIDFNQNKTTITSALIDPRSQATFDCSFNWSSFLGENASITVRFTYGANSSSIVYNLTVPYLKIANASFSDFPTGNPYMNVTIYNSIFSKTNATVTQISIQTTNKTFVIDGTLTSPKMPFSNPLDVGSTVTVVCPWDWSQYAGQDVTITVQTADGLQVSATFKVE